MNTLVSAFWNLFLFFALFRMNINFIKKLTLVFGYIRWFQIKCKNSSGELGFSFLHFCLGPVRLLCMTTEMYSVVGRKCFSKIQTTDYRLSYDLEDLDVCVLNGFYELWWDYFRKNIFQGKNEDRIVNKGLLNHESKITQPLRRLGCQFCARVYGSSMNML